MLGYQQYIWNKLQNDPNCLHIFCKGLDIFEIEKQLIFENSKNNKCVFVFGFPENYKMRTIWESENIGIESLPKDIEADKGKKERAKSYETNHVFFNSPGILAKDFLQGMIDPMRINGFIIHNADSIFKDPGLQLCLTYYRSHNDSGFITAFSENVFRFSDLKKALDLLWLRKLVLFPRFEGNIKESLSPCEAHIKEFSIKKTNTKQQKIIIGGEKTSFVPIVSQELVDVFHTLSALHKSFIEEHGKKLNLTISSSLQMSKKALLKRAISSEQKKVLENIIFFRDSFFILLNSEPTKFNEHVQTYQLRSPGIEHPLWFEFSQASTLFKVAEKYADDNVPNPKLQWILHFISHIPRDKKVLIFASRRETVNMISRHLFGMSKDTEINLPSFSDKESDDESNENAEKPPDIPVNSEFVSLIEAPMILLQKSNVQYDVLVEFQPDFVIFWDLKQISITQLEHYKNRYNKNVICYLLSFSDVSESGQMIEAQKLVDDTFIKKINELKSLHLLPLTPFKPGSREIIADDREFRSFLPLGLLKAEFKIIPEMITVGDYVLSDEIVIERKAYNDLVGSLSCGRLLSQLQRMKQYYQNPFLLLEFSDVEQFNALSAKDSKNNPMAMQKFMSLLYNFPDVKLLWARDYVEAGNTLRFLAKGTKPPSAEKAREMGNLAARINKKEESKQINFLLSIPFLTAEHVESIVEKCKSLRELATISKAEMSQILDFNIATKLYGLLHDSIKTA